MLAARPQPGGNLSPWQASLDAAAQIGTLPVLTAGQQEIAKNRPVRAKSLKHGVLPITSLSQSNIHVGEPGIQPPRYGNLLKLPRIRETR